MLSSIAVNPGEGEKDNLTGGSGKDTFVLGDSLNAYYQSSDTKRYGQSDYVQIKDFSLSEGDQIQLTGDSEDYLLIPNRSGTGIFLHDGTSPGFDKQDDLIGIIKRRINNVATTKKL